MSVEADSKQMEFNLAPAALEYVSFPGWAEKWAESEDPRSAGDPLLYKVSSIWSNLVVALDGKVYVAVSNHGIIGGNMAVYCYDPRAKGMAKVFDAIQQYGPEEESGQRHGKNHARLVEGSDGKIYGGTTASGGLPEGICYEGGHLFRYDPKNTEVEDLGIPVPGAGIYSLWLDEARGRIWGISAAGERNPPGRFIGYDLAERRTEVMIPAQGAQDCFMDARGLVYTQLRPGYLFRYDPDRNEMRELRSLPLPDDPALPADPARGAGGRGVVSCNSAILTGDGRIFHSTQGGHLFIFHPQRGEEGEFEHLGMNIGDGTYHSYQVNLALTPDESALYYLTHRASAYHPDLGPHSQMMRFDLGSRTRTHLGRVETDPPSVFSCFAAGVGADGTVYFGVHPPAKLAIYRP